MIFKVCVVILCAFMGSRADSKTCKVPTLCTEVVNGQEKRETKWKEVNCDNLEPLPNAASHEISGKNVYEPFASSDNVTRDLEAQVSALLTKVTAAIEPGWFNGLNGYQYWISAKGTSVPHETARLLCQHKGGYLAYNGPQDPESRQFIIDTITKRCKTDHSFWIGLSDVAEEGSFVWEDGTPANVNNTDWKEHQPDDWSGADCAVIAGYYHYQFDDQSCSANNGFICERYMGF